MFITDPLGNNKWSEHDKLKVGFLRNKKKMKGRK